MAGDNHGAETQEEPQAQEDLEEQQAQEEQPQMSGVDWKKAIAERDEKIAALEQQVADAAKSVEAAEKLSAEIDDLRKQGESDRIDFKLQLAGVRNIKAARAVLDDRGGDIDKLREAEPWLFADAPAPRQGGRTGLPNAGTSTDSGKTPRRWRRLAGLDDPDESQGGPTNGQRHRVHPELHFRHRQGLPARRRGRRVQLGPPHGEGRT